MTQIHNESASSAEYEAKVKECLRNIFKVVPPEELVFRPVPFVDALDQRIMSMLANLTVDEFLQLTKTVGAKAQAEEPQVVKISSSQVVTGAKQFTPAPVEEPAPEIEVKTKINPKTLGRQIADAKLRNMILAIRKEFTVYDIIEGRIDGNNYGRPRVDRVIKGLVLDKLLKSVSHGSKGPTVYNVIRSTEPIKDEAEKAEPKQEPAVVPEPVQPQEPPQKPVESKETPKVVPKDQGAVNKPAKLPTITMKDLATNPCIVRAIYKELYDRMVRVKNPIGQHDLKDLLYRNCGQELSKKYYLGDNQCILMREAHALLCAMCDDREYYHSKFGCIVKRNQEGTFQARPGPMNAYAHSKGWDTKN